MLHSERIPVTPPSLDALAGRVIGDKFHVQKWLGIGAMGRVYQANREDLERTVAIQVMRLNSEDPSGYAGRFRTEALVASRLDHPHSVRILDFGEDAHVRIMDIVME